MIHAFFALLLIGQAAFGWYVVFRVTGWMVARFFDRLDERSRA